MGEQVSRVAKTGYGIVEIGTNTLIIFASFHFLFYMTEALAVPPAAAGLLFFGAKIFDVITDPLVGNWSDRTNSPMGRRRPFMLAGGLMLGPVVAIMFLAPFLQSGSWWPSALYFMFFTMMTYLSLTLITVPGGALTAEMTDDYNERTNITAWRWGIGSIGMFIGGGIAPLFVSAFSASEADPEGYKAAAIILIPMLSLPILLGVWMLRSAPRKVAVKVPAVWAQAREVFSTPSFRILCFTYFLQVAAFTVVTSNLLYILKYHFLRTDPAADNAVFFGIFVIATMASMAFWSWLGSKVGKRSGYIISMTGLSLAVATVFLLNADSFFMLYIVMAVVGWFYGGYQVYPWSMVPDSVTEAQERTGLSLEGAFNGWFTTQQKLGIAFGPLVVGILLSSAGYVVPFYEDGLRVYPEQTEAAVTMIRICSSLIPAVVFFVSLVVVSRHRNAKKA